MRAALYARVSTTGQGQDVGLQLEELRQVAAQRGWRVVSEYVDEGVSGSKTTRPGLDRMLADAQAGKLELVAVWKLDWLGRSLQHILGVLDQFTAQGIAFVSLRDAGLDTTTPAGRLFTSIIGAFAEFERGLIQERVVAGVRRAQAAGTHCGRPRKQVEDKTLKAARADRAGLGTEVGVEGRRHPAGHAAAAAARGGHPAQQRQGGGAGGRPGYLIGVEFIQIS